jgi:hypothetical protein
LEQERIITVRAAAKKLNAKNERFMIKYFFD